MDNAYMNDPAALGAVLGGLFAFLAIFIVIAIVLYIFLAIGLYTLAKKEGDELAWLAFIPVAQYYTMGNLVKGNFTVFGKKIDRPEIILLVTAIVAPMLSMIPVLGFLAAIASMILFISAIYHVFRKYKGDRATMFTVLSVIFSFLFPFFIFAMRNDSPVDPSYNTGVSGNGFQGGSTYTNNSYNYDNYQNNNFNMTDDTSSSYHVSDNNDSSNGGSGQDE